MRPCMAKAPRSGRAGGNSGLNHSRQQRGDLLGDGAYPYVRRADRSFDAEVALHRHNEIRRDSRARWVADLEGGKEVAILGDAEYEPALCEVEGSQVDPKLVIRSAIQGGVAVRLRHVRAALVSELQGGTVEDEVAVHGHRASDLGTVRIDGNRRLQGVTLVRRTFIV